MNTAADAIGECVERFVQGILALIEQVREEHRAEARKVVAGMLAETERPAASRKAPAPVPRSAGSRTGGLSAKTPAAPKVPGAGSSERAPERGSRAAAKIGKVAPAKPEVQARGAEATGETKSPGTGEAAPTTGRERVASVASTPKEENSALMAAAVPSSTPAPVKGPGTAASSVTAPSKASPERTPRRRSRAAPTGEVAPTDGKAPTPEPSAVPPAPPTIPSTPAPANGTEMQKSEREAVVLAAVRALVRATASEVAVHTGQPNGSVSVVLRALVARGQVARTEAARGIEYALVSPGDIKPFKRARRAAPNASTEAPAPNATAAGAPAATSTLAAVRVVEPPSAPVATGPAAQPPPASAPSPSPVAPSRPAPRRRPRPNNPQLSLFDPPPLEPKG